MMRVSLMNLGDAPRVFHNRLNRAVVVPTGRVVIADLSARDIEGLRFSSKGETVLVGDESITEIPLEMQGVVDLLAVIEFEGHEKAVQRFMRVVPPGHATEIRPSRMQMRRYLQTMVEDYIAQKRNPEKVVHDDVSPRVLEEELRRQSEGAKRVPPHALEEVKRERNAGQPEVITPRAPRPLRVRGSAASPDARPSRKAARAGKRN